MKSRALIIMAVAFFVAVMLIPMPAPAAAAPDEKGPQAWQFEFTPYVFGSSLSGTTGVGRVTAEVDGSFSDIVENLDSGFMAKFEARKGPWGFLFDGVYFKLKDQKTASWQGPGGVGTADGSLEATMTEQIYQLAVSYRTLDSASKLDLIGAARYTKLDTELDLAVTAPPVLPGGTRSLSASESWWDPVIGIRVTVPFAEQWSFVGYADVGGFGAGSDVTYQAIAGVNWQFSKTFAAKVGYRYFYQDYENDGFVWDMAAHGLYLGLGIGF